MTHLTQQLFIGGTNINTDVEKFKHEGGNIIIGTPGRIEDLLMGKTDSSHRNLFVQAAKTLVSHHKRPKDLKKSRPKNSSKKLINSGIRIFFFLDRQTMDIVFHYFRQTQIFFVYQIDVFLISRVFFFGLDSF